jgi:hypothetical protein
MVESELSAEESLQLARHLPECTACRIRLAREKRLAQLMNALEDNLQVDDSFADGVMAALPDGPPPAPAGGRAWVRRRGLKLAGLAGLVALALSIASRVASLGYGGNALPGLPRFGFEETEPMFDGLLALLKNLVVSLTRIGSGMDLGISGWTGAAGLGPATVLPMFLALLMLSAAVGLASCTALRDQESPRLLMRLLSVDSEIPRRSAAVGRSPRDSVSTRRT